MQPDFAFGFNNRGNALNAMGRHEEALASYERALALKPDYTEAHNNRGNALLDLNRPAEALADYELAIAHKPFAFALVNRGSALHYLDRSTRHSIASIAPSRLTPNWQRRIGTRRCCVSRSAISNGAGPVMNGAGAAPPISRPRDFTQPQWRGEDLAGKTILLHAEQGFGDSIQFVRYLPMVAREGWQGRSGIAGQSDAADRRSRRRLIGIHRRGDALPAFDVHCPLMSLPLAFGTTIETFPASVPYLHRARPSASRRWRTRLPASGKPRIGLVWSGKPTPQERSQPQRSRLSRLVRFCRVAGSRFRQPATRIPGRRSAALDACRSCASMSLSPTSPTPRQRSPSSTWLLPSTPRWRTSPAPWASRSGSCCRISRIGAGCASAPDSPWYPSARLFRQPQIGDWDGVIARCGAGACRHSQRPRDS